MAVNNQVVRADFDRNKCHVVFMHNKLRRRKDDRYIVDLANGLKDHGHKVTILTTEVDRNNCFPELLPNKGDIDVKFSASYIPRNWYCLKAIIMAIRLCIFPPKPTPKVIVCDTNAIALFILSKLSSYKTILLAHFSAIQSLDLFSNYLKVTPDLLTVMSITHANEIVVQSECLGDIFRRSFPNYNRDLTFISPCVDTGSWKDDCIDIHRVIPDLPSNVHIFVVFGQYKKRSNFKLIMDTLEVFWIIADDNLKEKIHVVIGGNCNEKRPEELIYYDELLDAIKDKKYGSQISILKQLSIQQKKTLLKKCTAVLIPTKHDPFPDTILQALHMGKTIIATNSGYAKYAITHRISGILVDADPQKFAAAMIKLCTNPMVHTFICEMAADVFRSRFSYHCMARKINSVVEKQISERKNVVL
ncbi:alpha-1,3/1,6-mannosyltransferase ALG2-like [Onthophagus taurus]|uniref:alpha-1,3/1,6-mannosyltransferase ALG2-like n=1 Tax=Onthophagus taurus TaxID=166361 RepID=UPI000C20CA31|nr:alpha-1,3/1,6-mannosyltransferase ALG2-like [Onthophagus taurus]